eukprot:2772427-Pleurochrysis_carterae.AAC.1
MRGHRIAETSHCIMMTHTFMDATTRAEFAPCSLSLSRTRARVRSRFRMLWCLRSLPEPSTSAGAPPLGLCLCQALSFVTGEEELLVEGFAYAMHNRPGAASRAQARTRARRHRLVTANSSSELLCCIHCCSKHSFAVPSVRACFPCASCFPSLRACLLDDLMLSRCDHGAQRSSRCVPRVVLTRPRARVLATASCATLHADPTAHLDTAALMAALRPLLQQFEAINPTKRGGADVDPAGARGRYNRE